MAGTCEICNKQLKNLREHNTRRHTKTYWNQKTQEYTISCRPNHVFDVYEPTAPIENDKWISFVHKGRSTNCYSVSIKFRVYDDSSIHLTERSIRKSISCKEELTYHGTIYLSNIYFLKSFFKFSKK